MATLHSSGPPSPRRVAAGRLLDRAGQLGLPLGAGFFAGYWLGDFGVPWTPTMLGVLSSFCALALLLVLAGQWLKGKVVRHAEAGVKVRKRVVALLALACLAAALRLAVYWAAQPSPLTRLDAAALAAAFDADGRQVGELDAELDRLVGRLEALELFRGDGVRRPLTAAEEEVLHDTWRAFYDTAFALDQIRVFYEDWFRFDPSRAQRHQLVRSYLLTFDAELALYEKSLRFSRLVLGRREAERLLDAPHPRTDLPEHTFSLLRQELLGVRDQGRVLAGERYLRFLESTVDARRTAEERGFDDLWRRVEAHLAAIRAVAPLPERAVQTLRADFQVLKRTVRRTWFPAQKGVAEWMGDFKTRRRGRYLITGDQLAAARPRLAPGDVLLGRKNWYLSNVGLPGFWPHAMIYLGAPEELEAAFDAPDVRAAMVELVGEPLSLAQALARSYPREWERYRSGRDGEPTVVLEAVGEGVLLNTLAAASGDYLAALRPRLSPAAKARAVYLAFGQLGKPYDFDFDFATDHALMCTEVVWRSYRAAAGVEGLEMPLTVVAGRLTLPANDIARRYAEEADDPGRQLDFVLFLDARERLGLAVEADETAFRSSPARLKWDLFQR